MINWFAGFQLSTVYLLKKRPFFWILLLAMGFFRRILQVYLGGVLHTPHATLRSVEVGLLCKGPPNDGLVKLALQGHIPPKN